MAESITQLQAAARGDAQAQFALGMALARSGEIRRALVWYERAAAAGHVPARRERALLQLFGVGLPRDPSAALPALEQAAAAGDDDATYWLARQAFLTAAPERLAAVLMTLAPAALRGHPQSARTLGLVHAAAGDAAGAHRFLALAAGSGDAHAAALLTCLDAGAAETDPSSLPDPADVIAAALSTAGTQPTMVHDDPSVRTFDDLLSPLDCAHLLHLARPRLRPSYTVHPVSGEIVHNDIRTSSSAAIEPFQEDPWALWLQRRMCGLAGAELAMAEPLSVLHYAPGQEYRPHRDYLPPSALASPDGLRGGQRLRTVFVYLNDVAAGGETDFPELGVKIESRQGRAVLFDNVHADGSPDPRTIHAGCPVIEGEKWLATLWLREHPVRDGQGA